jgi:hypothetical protein
VLDVWCCVSLPDCPSVPPQAAPQHLESQLAAAEVYGRKGRLLLEAAAVKRARDIAGSDHPDVHRAIVRFAQRGESLGGGGEDQ